MIEKYNNTTREKHTSSLKFTKHIKYNMELYKFGLANPYSHIIKSKHNENIIPLRLYIFILKHPTTTFSKY